MDPPRLVGYSPLLTRAEVRFRQSVRLPSRLLAPGAVATTARNEVATMSWPTAGTQLGDRHSIPLNPVAFLTKLGTKTFEQKPVTMERTWLGHSAGL